MARIKSYRDFKGYYMSEGVTISDLRELIGISSKLILPPKDQNFQQNIQLQQRLGFRYDRCAVAQSVLEPMVKGFKETNRRTLFSNVQFLEILKAFVRYDRVLSNPRCQIKTRKKRMTRFRKEMKKMLTEKQIKGAKGSGLFISSIKLQFLSN